MSLLLPLLLNCIAYVNVWLAFDGCTCILDSYMWSWMTLALSGFGFQEALLGGAALPALRILTKNQQAMVKR